MNVLFFISHQPNPRFIKQINFLSKNHMVTLINFHREVLANLNDSLDKSVIIHDLGKIPNASQPFKRVSAYIKAIKQVRNKLSKTNYEVTLVNNIDIVLLYLLARFRLFKKIKSTVLVIEISDLRKFVFSNSFISKFMRFLETYLYKNHIDKLIVTSKRYYTYHFEKFFNKDVFVLENKLMSAELNLDSDITKKKNDKTIIGIVGLLLRKDEYIKLFETYKDNPEIEIHIYGKGYYQYVVEEYASKYLNITYFGPYNSFTDAQNIYSSLDIIYLVYDIDQVSLNNRLALPNKLYECMYYKVPLICSKQTYLEEFVMDLGIGVAVDYKESNALEKAVLFIKENKNMFEDNFSSLPKNKYFGDEDYKELESFLIV